MRQLTQTSALPFALRHSGLLSSGIRSAAASRRTFAAQAVAAAPATIKHDIIKEAHGFVLDRQQFVQEYDSTVLLYKHKRTGECMGTSTWPSATQATEAASSIASHKDPAAAVSPPSKQPSASSHPCDTTTSQNPRTAPHAALLPHNHPPSHPALHPSTHSPLPPPSLRRC
jgi:hypothetical protein